MPVGSGAFATGWVDPIQGGLPISHNNNGLGRAWAPDGGLGGPGRPAFGFGRIEPDRNLLPVGPQGFGIGDVLANQGNTGRSGELGSILGTPSVLHRHASDQVHHADLLSSVITQPQAFQPAQEAVETSLPAPDWAGVEVHHPFPSAEERHQLAVQNLVEDDVPSSVPVEQEDTAPAAEVLSETVQQTEQSESVLDAPHEEATEHSEETQPQASEPPHAVALPATSTVAIAKAAKKAAKQAAKQAAAAEVRQKSSPEEQQTESKHKKKAAKPLEENTEPAAATTVSGVVWKAAEVAAAVPKKSLKDIQAAEEREREEKERERQKRAQAAVLAEAQALAEQQAAGASAALLTTGSVWGSTPKLAAKGKSNLANIMEEEATRKRKQDAAAAAAVASATAAASSAAAAASAVSLLTAPAKSTAAAPTPAWTQAASRGAAVVTVKPPAATAPAAAKQAAVVAS
ncbi:hypothetical protein HK405_003417, partial [Cladochytrium tenue]